MSPKKTVPAAEDDLAAAYSKAFNKDSGWAPASETIKEVVSVPTIFYGFNYASHCGGCPLDRVYTLTGPSAGGKSLLALGFVKSFIERMLLAGYIDAERTLEPGFVNAVMGGGFEKFPNFVQPKTSIFYEDAIKNTDEFMAKSRKFRDQFGERFTGSLLVVDSISKLQGKGFLESSLKELSDAAGNTAATDAVKGHGGMVQARFNNDWMNRLTAQCAESVSSVMLIAQERESKDAMGYPQYKVKGGQCLIYDASMVIRVVKPGGEKGMIKSGSDIIGSRHEIRIMKSKFGFLEEGKFSRTEFFFSNGKGPTPKGIDKWRDLLETGVTNEVIAKAGAWYDFQGHRFQGKEAFLESLVADPGFFKELETAVIENEVTTRSFRRHDICEIDHETGELIPD